MLDTVLKEVYYSSTVVEVLTTLSGEHRILLEVERERTMGRRQTLRVRSRRVAAAPSKYTLRVLSRFKV